MSSENAVVPVEATEAMLEAGVDNLFGSAFDDWKEEARLVWSAMLAAAPKPAMAGSKEVREAVARIEQLVRMLDEAARDRFDGWEAAARRASDLRLLLSLTAEGRDDVLREALGEMAAAGASDAACYLYPGESQAAERAAFCEGAAHSVKGIVPGEQK